MCRNRSDGDTKARRWRCFGQHVSSSHCVANQPIAAGKVKGRRRASTTECHRSIHTLSWPTGPWSLVSPILPVYPPRRALQSQRSASSGLSGHPLSLRPHPWSVSLCGLAAHFSLAGVAGALRRSSILTPTFVSWPFCPSLRSASSHHLTSPSLFPSFLSLPPSLVSLFNPDKAFSIR